jgi:hypothetical protein
MWMGMNPSRADRPFYGNETPLRAILGDTVGNCVRGLMLRVKKPLLSEGRVYKKRGPQNSCKCANSQPFIKSYILTILLQRFASSQPTNKAYTDAA